MFVFSVCIPGTTALVAMVTKTDIIVANVGDSRGVMCDKHGNAVPLSEDHKPNNVSLTIFSSPDFHNYTR